MFCYEVGENGTPHLQIYARSKTKLSVNAWHDQLGRRISSIQPTANLERTIKYCQGFAFNLDTKNMRKSLAVVNLKNMEGSQNREREMI